MSDRAPTQRGFLRRYLFTTDHTMVAKQYLWFGLTFLWIGGVMAMNIRWVLAYPGRVSPFLGPLLYFRTHGVIGPMDYATMFTLHGTTMVFFAVTPIVIGWLGNLVIPLMLGARGPALPWLSAAGFWLTFIGGMVLLTAMYMPYGGPAAGWTSYPPLSASTGSPGQGQNLWCIAILFTGCGTILGAINHIATIVRRRAPGMGYFRMPLTVWGLWMTSILNVLFVPVLAVGTVLLLLDRIAGTRFFEAGMSAAHGGGDPVLYQHMFWIFGHPEVYILILPVWGVVSDLLAVFARKPAYGYRSTALAMVAITVLSGLVYGHHMFTTGLRPILAQAFMTLTVLISIPSAILFINWLGTLWQGSIRFSAPMIYCLGVVVVFAAGGLTGMFLGAVTTDIYLHDTFFVVGHFHFVMAAAVLLGGFAAIHFWFPKAFGRMMNERVARVHAIGSVALLVIVFGAMLLLGWGGMLRRSYNASAYTYVAHVTGLNKAVTHAAFALFAVQFLFIGNFLWSMLKGKPAPANPWDAAGLEWTIASPPPPGNFADIPVVHRGPHEYAHPSAKDRDWLAQDEPLSDRSDETR